MRRVPITYPETATAVLRGQTVQERHTVLGSALKACLYWVVAACAVPSAAAELPSTPKHVNSVGMRLVRIEAGEFVMGTAQGGDFDERPVHRVRITRPFYLGVTEVTNAQYEQFDPAHRKLRGKLGFSRADDEAVVFVSWRDAMSFCQWLAAKEAQPYRLPTEAEWEYACRAGSTTAYHTGDKLSDPAFRNNAVESWFPSRPDKQPIALGVGRTPANAWDLFDMHGNVEEWCLDWYGPYQAQDQTDPVGRADGDFRVTRGGSHSTTLEYLRSANRLGTLPDDKSWLIGFRVAFGELPAAKPAGSQRPSIAVPQKQIAVPQKQAETREEIKGGSKEPYFRGPRQYVTVPPGSEGPLFSRHNHDPAIVECPNGDLLAIWYTCRTEAGANSPWHRVGYARARRLGTARAILGRAGSQRPRARALVRRQDPLSLRGSVGGRDLGKPGRGPSHLGRQRTHMVEGAADPARARHSASTRRIGPPHARSPNPASLRRRTGRKRRHGDPLEPRRRTDVARSRGSPGHTAFHVGLDRGMDCGHSRRGGPARRWTAHGHGTQRQHRRPDADEHLGRPREELELLGQSLPTDRRRTAPGASPPERGPDLPGFVRHPNADRRCRRPAARGFGLVRRPSRSMKDVPGRCGVW